MMSEESKQPEEMESAPAPRQRSGNEWRQWTRDLLVSVLVSVVIITCLYQPVRVEGTSMQPELRNSDRLFINKFVYHFEGISRGDVVVFHYPLNPKESFIKRVIGLPGDHIRIDQGTVYINGKALKEPYVPARYRDRRSMAAGVVPPHEYFVMGDHRNISEDSRDFGPVPRSDIYGKASFIYWPAGQMGAVH
jgi:signal peptidase I